MSRVGGKVAFVTGAARGQGRSHAVRLAKEGADIIAVDLCRPVETVGYPMSTPEDLAETVRLVEATGRKIVAAEADVRDYEALAKALRSGVDELGRLDYVVANAGVLSQGPAHEQSEQQFQTVVDINLTGVWKTTKAAIPILIDQGTGGAMVLTSSVMGLRGSPGLVGYVAAKFGVVGMTKTLAQELAPHRVRVNAVHPTNAHTPMIVNDMMSRTLRPDLPNPQIEDAKEILSSFNLWDEPWVEPEDVSSAVLWLLSEESRYVTGISLPVDLGATTK
jgi:SDR family mycofactocin-dependent oxidoreductase